MFFFSIIIIIHLVLVCPSLIQQPQQQRALPSPKQQFPKLQKPQQEQKEQNQQEHQPQPQLQHDEEKPVAEKYPQPQVHQPSSASQESRRFLKPESMTKLLPKQQSKNGKKQSSKDMNKDRSSSLITLSLSPSTLAEPTMVETSWVCPLPNTFILTKSLKRKVGPLVCFPPLEIFSCQYYSLYSSPINYIYPMNVHFLSNFPRFIYLAFQLCFENYFFFG